MIDGKRRRFGKSSIILMFLTLTAATAGYLSYLNQTSSELHVNHHAESQEKSLEPVHTTRSEPFESRLEHEQQEPRILTMRSPESENSKPVESGGDVKRVDSFLQPTTTASEPLRSEQEQSKPVENGREKLKKAEFWFWLGLGENYQYHEQTIPNISEQAKFQNIQGPAILLDAGMMGQKFGAEVSYKETPGRMDSSSTVTVRDGDFKWKTLAGEGLYHLEDSDYLLRLGIQYHSMPFMDLDATNSILTVRSNSLAMATFGFEKKYLISKRLRGEWLMRYQYPVMAGTSDGNTFTVETEFAFDGSLGGIYHYNDNLRFGLYWYGQWHQFGFKYSPTNSSSFTGRQVLFYSNVELRLGWEF